MGRPPFSLPLINRRTELTRRRRSLAAPYAAGLLLFGLVLGLCSRAASAQNIEFTQGSVGSGLDNGLHIPIRTYPGRGSTSLPVTLYYSSRVWRIGALETVVNTQFAQLQSISEAVYAEHSNAGWTTSLEPPRIEWPRDSDQYNASGKEHCGVCGTGGGWRIARVFVHMPDGSTHELRKGDDAYQGPVDKYGTFYAVDGSRLRYDSLGPTAGTLFMADGSRYVLTATTAQFIDRHGNALYYNASARQWTDTLGRVIGMPWPAVPQAQDYAYAPPGVRADKPYVFRWRNLSDALLSPGSQNLRVMASHYLPFPNSAPTGPGGNNFPAPNPGPPPNQGQNLFHSAEADSDAVLETLVVGRGQSPGQLFNPVVLSEVVLPTGLTYKFYYDEYGEVVKVVYPTGAYDQYSYAPVPVAGESKQPYSQANRGVTLRQQSAKGDGTDIAQWQYAAAMVWDSVSVGSNGNLVITTTAPDNTRAEVYKRVYRPAPHGHDNAVYWPFGYEDPRNGLPHDERVYAPNPDGTKGPMLSRSLTEYEFTSRTIAQRPPVFQGQRVAAAMRNVRAKRSVSLLLDTGADALAKSVSYRYCPLDAFGAPACPAQEMTTGLDLLEITETHFALVPQATAQTGAASSIPAGATASISETTYLDDPDYAARNILGLATSVVLKDSAGQPVSKTETFYDEAGYLPVTYGDLAGDPNYADPATDVRANPTTLRRYVDVAAGTYLETHAQFDQCGNSVGFWDERGIESQKEYSSAYKHAYLTQTTSTAPDPNGTYGSNQPFTSATTYDAVTGATLTTTDANGQVIEFRYGDEQGVADPLNRLRKVIRPDGGWTKTDFNDVVGNLYVHTETTLDETRRTHAYQFFDKLGRPVRSLASEGGTSYIAADTRYDQLGRVSQSSNPYRTQTFGGAGQGTLWTTTQYDAMGRVKTLTLPDGSSVQTFYQGQYTTVLDQAGKQRRQKTDAQGRVVRVDEPDASGNLGSLVAPVQPTFYEYDTQGNLVRLSQGISQPGLNPEDPGSYRQRRYFKYDAPARLTHERHVEQAGTHSLYDPLTGNSAWSRKLAYDETVGGVSYKGLLTAETDARNVTSQFFYDQLNRAYRVTYTDGTPALTNKYDQARAGFFNKGRLTEVSTAATSAAPPTSQAYDYDLMGRIVSQRQTVDAHTYTLGYQYGLGGQLKSQTYPSGKVISYGYDDASRLRSVSSGATTYAGLMTYKPHGGLESMSMGNGSVYSMGYGEARLQLASISLTHGATTVQRFEYKYGRVDMATGVVDETKNNGQVGRIEGFVGAQKQWQQRFGYDNLGRLTSAGEFFGANDAQRAYLLSYDYDAFGNRHQKSSSNQNNPLTQHWVEDGGFNPATNRLTSGVTYDPAGNVTADSRFRQRLFSYDANSRERQSSNLDGSGAVVSVYDGAGQRVATRVNGQLATVMVYDAAGKLVAEYGQGVAYAGTQYVMPDHQDSTRVVMSGSAVVSRHDYLPFGEELYAGVGSRAAGQGYAQADGVRRKYAGMESGEVAGMSHTLWRQYDSHSGRWSAPDPYGGSMDISSPQTLNRYTYVNNDPVNKVDPTGLMLSDIGVVQTNDPGFASSLQQWSDEDHKKSINEDYENRHNWIIEEVQSGTAPLTFDIGGQQPQNQAQQDLALINQAYPSLTEDETRIADEAIADAIAMVNAPAREGETGCHAALVSNFGPLVGISLRGLRTTGGVANIDATGNVARVEMPQNVFSGDSSSREVNDDNGNRTTVSRFLQQHTTVRAVTVTDPDDRSPGDIYLSRRFFRNNREGRAQDMIHEAVTHRGNGRNDAEFAPRNSTSPRADGSGRINEIIRRHCRLP